MMKSSVLEVYEEKGLKDVMVFQVCDNDAVAAHSPAEARSWYQEKTGLTEYEIYSPEEIEVVSLDHTVFKGEDCRELITVREIIETYWEGKPFIAITEFY